VQELVEQLGNCLAKSKPFAYCRLVETRGSTPQKPGATMLVFPNGDQAGTLGGGCVEADVKRQALKVLEDDQACVATFQLDHDYGWDDGLICGGRMKILIQPVLGSPITRVYYQQLYALLPAGGGTEVVAFDESRSGLREPSCFLFDAACRPMASIPTADHFPETIRSNLQPLASRPHAYASQGVAYLPMLARCPLVIVGGGHVGKAVAELAADLDFDVWIVDDREEFANKTRFPRAAKWLWGDLDEVLPDLPISADTYCLIMTRGHSHDERALYHLADRGARYVGMIGSRRKVRMIFEDLLHEGISREALQRVHAPLGVSIGSKTVPEIAISIAAELVAHRNCGGRVPGRPEKVEVPETNE
jgi:xanthine dehydrogenase accessory factor